MENHVDEDAKESTEGLDIPLGKLGLVFSSNFDSGNLQSVTLLEERNNSEGSDFAAYQVSTRPDCFGTKFQNGNRTWFYFSVTGGIQGNSINICVHDLNKQGKLFSQGHEPVVCVLSASQASDAPESETKHGNVQKQWSRDCENINFDTTDDDIFWVSWDYTFDHRFQKDQCLQVFFAWCYPHSYEDCQAMLSQYDQLYSKKSWREWILANEAVLDGATQDPIASESVDRSNDLSYGGDVEAGRISHSTPTEHVEDTRNQLQEIYYYREELTRTLDGWRVDLLTVSSCENLTAKREPKLPLLFPNTNQRRAHQFKEKDVFFLTARVHPGETPASFVFNGFLEFILRKNDPVAIELRRKYVFKMIPMLNPDGVRRGHYRTDSRGVNLNRVYCTPNPNLHSPIYASRVLCDYYNEQQTLKFYVDLHAHASKRGCFIFGNALELSRQIENVLYPKLVAKHSAFFDFEACNFSEKNMFSRDKKDGLSKEGSGRVGTFLATNLCHCYTLECNYNSGREYCKDTGSSDSESEEERGSANQRQDSASPKPYTIESFEDVGRGVAKAALDILGLPLLPHTTNEDDLESLRDSLKESIKRARTRKGKDATVMPPRVAVALRRQRSMQTRNNIAFAARSISGRDQATFKKEISGHRGVPSSKTNRKKQQVKVRTLPSQPNAIKRSIKTSDPIAKTPTFTSKSRTVFPVTSIGLGTMRRGYGTLEAKKLTVATASERIDKYGHDTNRLQRTRYSIHKHN
eukprot:m.261064 g.261064  ORF g.261064 m.261064 type:complete len:748 (-) comp16215_c0_seq14:2334-4577(-)